MIFIMWLKVLRPRLSSTANDDYGGLTPHAYLRNPKIGWDERAKIGRDAPVTYGVMKR
jgi:hypothetical protein